MESGSFEKDREWLNGDTVTLIIEGRYDIRSELFCPILRILDINQLTFRSDNVGTTLTFVFYHLAQSPAYQHMIRQELVKVSSMTDIQTLKNLPGLQSVIKESLRLYPPIPTGANRESGPDWSND